MPASAGSCTKPYSVQWITGLPPQPGCPLRQQSRCSWLLQLYVDYQHGHLPRAGGSLDQPAWLMDAIATIGEVMAESPP